MYWRFLATQLTCYNQFWVNKCGFLYQYPWWRHQMETFPRYWPFVRGIHRSPVNSPHKGQWHGALKFSLICVWIKGWVNNREAGDLRRYCAHYDVIVMCTGRYAHAGIPFGCPSFALARPYHHCGCRSLQWRYNGRVSLSNHQPRECLLSRLIRRRSK